MARQTWDTLLYLLMILLLVASLVLIDVLLGGLSTHSVVGLLLVLALAVHVAGRRPWLAAVWKSLRGNRKLGGGTRGAFVRNAALAITAIALTVTGVVQWSGVLAAKPWHSSATILFVVALLVHVVANRRPLGQQLKILVDRSDH